MVEDVGELYDSVTKDGGDCRNIDVSTPTTTGFAKRPLLLSNDPSGCDAAMNGGDVGSDAEGDAKRFRMDETVVMKKDE